VGRERIADAEGKRERYNHKSMSATPKTHWAATLEEYFAADAASAERLYYIDGHVNVMQGGSRAHEEIILNLAEFVRPKLRGGPCEMAGAGTRLRFGKRVDYGYADGSIFCGEAIYEDSSEAELTLLNPRIIFEVLSDSTERFDRVDKFLKYKGIESFEEYVLISQHEPLVQTHLRDPRGGWNGVDYVGMDETVTLRSIGVAVPVTDIYRGVRFAKPFMRPA
jgi:Uma2 family endonuclease